MKQEDYGASSSFAESSRYSGDDPTLRVETHTSGLAAAAERRGEGVHANVHAPTAEASTEKETERSQALSARYVAYLGCIKDNWSSCHAAKLLDEELIAYLRPRFVLLSTPLKVRVLTSLLYIKTELREKCSEILSDITKEGETDPNEWVKKLSRILIPYINSGKIDLRETDTETAFRIIHFLDEQKALNPQQGPYRQKAGLEEQHMCEPHADIETASAVAAAASSDNPLSSLLKLPQKGVLEMTLFSAKDNFDTLLKGVVLRGSQELRKAQRAQIQREKALNQKH